MAGVRLLSVSLPAGTAGGFSQRAGGHSAPPYAGLNLGDHVGDDPRAVTANRHALARELGVRRVVFSRQVHGARVHRVDAADSDTKPEIEPGTGIGREPPECDALVTALRGVALGVLVADCVPVILADARAGVIAVAHAGRRGLVAGVLPNAVTAMSALGSDPADVTAVVGPAIGGCCYEVPAELRSAVAAVVPEVTSRTTWGTPALDLPRGAAAVLRGTGVGRIHGVKACTCTDDRFYSYRRAAVSGRFAGVVVRR